MIFYAILQYLNIGPYLTLLLPLLFPFFSLPLLVPSPPSFLSNVSLQMNVAVGTKLEYVMGHLAFEAAHMNDKHINNMKNLKTRDTLFWLHRPKLMLNLVHLTIFVVSGVCQE